MEGVGMVNASKNSQRINVAATTANKMESNHSRAGDFFFLDSTELEVNSLLTAMRCLIVRILKF